MRYPSGEKAGLSFATPSCVSCTGSPLGSIFIDLCDPDKLVGTRRKVSIRPSGESAGWLTESEKFVMWTRSVRGMEEPLRAYAAFKLLPLLSNSVRELLLSMVKGIAGGRQTSSHGA
jgi:hypothetical protein